MVSRIVFHAGLAKTRTTSLQWWFKKNRDRLGRAGVAYPERYGGFLYNTKHSFLVQRLYRHHQIDEISYDLEQHRQSETILYSEEGVTNHLYDFNEKALASFRSVTADVDTQLIYVSRKPESWLRSYYRQCVIVPNNGASELWGTSLTLEEIRTQPRIIALMNLEQLRADIRLKLGIEKITEINFEDPDWFRKILREIDAEELHSELPHINETLPEWLIEVFRQANGLSPELMSWKAWRVAAQKFLRTSNTVLLKANEFKIKGQAPESVGEKSGIVSAMIDDVSLNNDWPVDDRDEFDRFAAFVRRHGL